MKTVLMLVLMLAAGLVTVGLAGNKPQEKPGKGDIMPESPKNLKTATFAGGCFWCMESPYAKLAGVRTVISGYAGGHVAHPTYAAVCSGNTGHAESVQVLYDPMVISYATLAHQVAALGYTPMDSMAPIFPAADPLVAGAWWDNAGVLTKSTGGI